MSFILSAVLSYKMAGYEAPASAWIHYWLGLLTHVSLGIDC